MSRSYWLSSEKSDQTSHGNRSRSYRLCMPMNEVLRLARRSTSQLAFFAKLPTSSGNATNLTYPWNDTRLEKLHSDSMGTRRRIDPLLLSHTQCYSAIQFIV